MRVLVAEDEKDLADAIALGLRREGYAVDVAYDGDDAFVKARVYPYDLVCLDLNMPGLDGRGRLPPPARRPRGARPAISNATARDGVADRIGGLDDGDGLLPRQAVPLRGAEGANPRPSAPRARRSSTVLRVGGLELDVARHELAATGSRSRLAEATRAAPLLHVIPAKCSPRDALLTHVWDENADRRRGPSASPS